MHKTRVSYINRERCRGGGGETGRHHKCTDLVHTAFQGGQDGGVKLSLHVHDAAAAPHRGRRFDGHRFRWLAQLSPSSGLLTSGWGGCVQLYSTNNNTERQHHQASTTTVSNWIWTSCQPHRGTPGWQHQWQTRCKLSETRPRHKNRDNNDDKQDVNCLKQDQGIKTETTMTTNKM